MLQSDNHMKQANTFRILGHHAKFSSSELLMLSTSGKMLSIKGLCAAIRLFSHADTAPRAQRRLPGSPLASSSRTRGKPEQASGSGRSSRSFDLREHGKVMAQSRSLLKNGRGYREGRKE